MKTHQAKLRLVGRHAFAANHAVLDSAAVLGLGRVVAHEITQTWTQTTLDVTLRRPTTQAALNDLLVLVQEYGYSLVNGEITSYVSEAVSASILGALGGGGIGAATDDARVALVVGLIGAIAGSYVGSKVQQAEAVFQVVPNYQGGWTFTEIPLANPQVRTTPV